MQYGSCYVVQVQRFNKEEGSDGRIRETFDEFLKRQKKNKKIRPLERQGSFTWEEYRTTNLLIKVKVERSV